jgi:hypothetical protein
MEKTTEEIIASPEDVARPPARRSHRPLALGIVLCLVSLAIGALASMLLSPRFENLRARPSAWSPELRDDVYAQCIDQVAQHNASAAEILQPGAFCTCFTRALERVSPDPDTEATASEGRAAVRACVPRAEGADL